MRHYFPQLFSLLALFAARATIANAACPPPSVAQAGSCVLHQDATLTDTMWLTSGTTFNCQGHRLQPRASGTLDNPRTATNEFQPSQPELALFVRHAYNVSVQNCVISDFDFGIIVAQSKAVDAPGGQTSADTGSITNPRSIKWPDHSCSRRPEGYQSFGPGMRDEEINDLLVGPCRAHRLNGTNARLTTEFTV